MSRRTSRWRSFRLPNFSLCSISTYPFKMDNGVFRSCAAEANAFVVLRYRSWSCENSCDCSTSGAEPPAEPKDPGFSDVDDSWMVDDKWGIVSNHTRGGTRQPS